MLIGITRRSQDVLQSMKEEFTVSQRLQLYYISNPSLQLRKGLWGLPFILSSQP